MEVVKAAKQWNVKAETVKTLKAAKQLESSTDCTGKYPEAAKTSNEEHVAGKVSSSGWNSPTSSNRQNLV